LAADLGHPRVGDRPGEPPVADHPGDVEVSSTTTSWVVANRVVSRCSPSRRWFAIRAWMRASRAARFRRRLLPGLVRAYGPATPCAASAGTASGTADSGWSRRSTGQRGASHPGPPRPERPLPPRQAGGNLPLHLHCERHEPAARGPGPSSLPPQRRPACQRWRIRGDAEKRDDAGHTMKHSGSNGTLSASMSR
jgi:hypothetical protein